MEKKYIDMHIHSNFSDGIFKPCEIVNFASGNNTKMLSITDHDSINAIPEFKLYLKDNMYGVTGTEFSSYIFVDGKRFKLHILGYCFDVNNNKLKLIIDSYKEKRLNTHKTFLNNLKNILTKIPEKEISNLNMEKYCWFDREVIKCFKEAKISTDVVTFLINYSKTNRFSYGKDYELNVEDIIEVIHSSGGYAILAHPMAYSYSKEDILKIITKLKEKGIDGLEVYQSDCTLTDSIWLNIIASKYNLLTSVGSDFHRNIETDGREIATGINNNLCIEETTLTNKIIRKKQYFTRKD